MDDKYCCLCYTSDEDILEFGGLLDFGSIQAHKFCLLLSNKLQQNATKNEGLFGFREQDIVQVTNEALLTKCSYCSVEGATIFCCYENCNIKFHLPCGKLHGAAHRFYGDFRSYCSDHRIIEIMVPNLETAVTPANNCSVCSYIVQPYPNINTLATNCCFNMTFFHKKCIQSLALTTEPFKCPSCDDLNYFQFLMLHQGIYIPSIRWKIVRCKKCNVEELIQDLNKMKSAEEVECCNLCIALSLNTDVNCDCQVVTSSESSDDDSEPRNLLLPSSNYSEIEQPGCSEEQSHSASDSARDFAATPHRVLRSHIKKLPSSNYSEIEQPGCSEEQSHSASDSALDFAATPHRVLRSHIKRERVSEKGEKSIPKMKNEQPGSSKEQSHSASDSARDFAATPQRVLTLHMERERVGEKGEKLIPKKNKMKIEQPGSSKEQSHSASDSARDFAATPQRVLTLHMKGERVGEKGEKSIPKKNKMKIEQPGSSKEQSHSASDSARDFAATPQRVLRSHIKRERVGEKGEKLIPQKKEMKIEQPGSSKEQSHSASDSARDFAATPQRVLTLHMKGERVGEKGEKSIPKKNKMKNEQPGSSKEQSHSASDSARDFAATPQRVLTLHMKGERVGEKGEKSIPKKNKMKNEQPGSSKEQSHSASDSARDFAATPDRVLILHMKGERVGEKGEKSIPKKNKMKIEQPGSSKEQSHGASDSARDFAATPHRVLRSHIKRERVGEKGEKLIPQKKEMKIEQPGSSKELSHSASDSARDFAATPQRVLTLHMERERVGEKGEKLIPKKNKMKIEQPGSSKEQSHSASDSARDFAATPQRVLTLHMKGERVGEKGEKSIPKKNKMKNEQPGSSKEQSHSASDSARDFAATPDRVLILHMKGERVGEKVEKSIPKKNKMKIEQPGSSKEQSHSASDSARDFAATPHRVLRSHIKRERVGEKGEKLIPQKKEMKIEQPGSSKEQSHSASDSARDFAATPQRVLTLHMERERVGEKGEKLIPKKNKMMIEQPGSSKEQSHSASDSARDFAATPQRVLTLHMKRESVGEKGEKSIPKKNKMKIEQPGSSKEQSHSASDSARDFAATPQRVLRSHIKRERVGEKGEKLIPQKKEMKIEQPGSSKEQSHSASDSARDFAATPQRVLTLHMKGERVGEKGEKSIPKKNKMKNEQPGSSKEQSHSASDSARDFAATPDRVLILHMKGERVGEKGEKSIPKKNKMKIEQPGSSKEQSHSASDSARDFAATPDRVLILHMKRERVGERGEKSIPKKNKMKIEQPGSSREQSYSASDSARDFAATPQRVLTLHMKRERVGEKGEKSIPKKNKMKIEQPGSSKEQSYSASDSARDFAATPQRVLTLHMKRERVSEKGEKSIPKKNKMKIEQPGSSKEQSHSASDSALDFAATPHRVLRSHIKRERVGEKGEKLIPPKKEMKIEQPGSSKEQSHSASDSARDFAATPQRVLTLHMERERVGEKGEKLIPKKNKMKIEQPGSSKEQSHSASDSARDFAATPQRVLTLHMKGERVSEKGEKSIPKKNKMKIEQPGSSKEQSHSASDSARDFAATPQRVLILHMKGESVGEKGQKSIPKKNKMKIEQPGSSKEQSHSASDSARDFAATPYRVLRSHIKRERVSEKGEKLIPQKKEMKIEQPGSSKEQTHSAYDSARDFAATPQRVLTLHMKRERVSEKGEKSIQKNNKMKIDQPGSSKEQSHSASDSALDFAATPQRVLTLHMKGERVGEKGEKSIPKINKMKIEQPGSSKEQSHSASDSARDFAATPHRVLRSHIKRERVGEKGEKLIPQKKEMKIEQPGSSKEQSHSASDSARDFAATPRRVLKLHIKRETVGIKGEKSILKKNNMKIEQPGSSKEQSHSASDSARDFAATPHRVITVHVKRERVGEKGEKSIPHPKKMKIEQSGSSKEQSLSASDSARGFAALPHRVLTLHIKRERVGEKGEKPIPPPKKMKIEQPGSSKEQSHSASDSARDFAATPHRVLKLHIKRETVGIKGEKSIPKKNNMKIEQPGSSKEQSHSASDSARDFAATPHRVLTLHIKRERVGEKGEKSIPLPKKMKIEQPGSSKEQSHSASDSARDFAATPHRVLKGHIRRGIVIEKKNKSTPKNNKLSSHSYCGPVTRERALRELEQLKAEKRCLRSQNTEIKKEWQPQDCSTRNIKREKK